MKIFLLKKKNEELQNLKKKNYLLCKVYFPNFLVKKKQLYIYISTIMFLRLGTVYNVLCTVFVYCVIYLAKMFLLTYKMNVVKIIFIYI